MRDLVLRNFTDYCYCVFIKIPEPFNHLERTYMRKFIVTLMASLLSCSAAFAFWPEATDSSLEIGVGYRQDRLEWKTHAHSSSYGSDDDYDFPFGINSHVKWRNLNIWEIVAEGEYVTCDNLYFRANADYGWITDGKNKDKDRFSFSSLDYSSSNSKARGEVYDVRAAIGYQFKMCDDSFAVSPVIGYSWHGQHIRDRGLKNDSSYDCSCDYAYSGSYGDNHSKYRTRWNGPFIGLDFDYRFGCGCEADWEVFGSYEFHWAKYRAEANWQLRTDLFDGFRHRADDAYGQIFDIGVKWDFCECWTLALKGEFQWWWADHGHDTAKIAEASFGDVSTNCHLRIPLRDVKWDSAAVQLLVGMVF